MISTEVENIGRALEELHCSLRKFAEITRYSQPRLAEILRGARQPGRYEMALFTHAIARMRDLQADVRAHVGAPIFVVWGSQIHDLLEARHATGRNEFSVGIKYPKPELKHDGLTGAESGK